jgi:NADPH-dependent glutamate synthase beta subunit-like oxidoreductase/NAD(P)H-flavin reductase
LGRNPLWSFKRDFAKKLHRPDAGKSWGTHGLTLSDASHVVALLDRALPCEPGDDEELRTARHVTSVLEVDEIARKVKKAGGAVWTEALRDRARLIAKLLAADDRVTASKPTLFVADDLTDGRLGDIVAFVLDAYEAHLAARVHDHADPAHRWPSCHHPKSLDYAHLVELRRPSEQLPELFVGPEHERREREGFDLTDRRADARLAEREVDYCLYCHDRDKDSCSKGLRDNKTRELKKNPLSVVLEGCPLEEKISEAHTVRKDGDPLAALALITVDNPMCPGTGHRICNDCMKACVFQKQEPVNIPMVETRVLSEILNLPWGTEIYGFLTRWNPLQVERPHLRAYNGKNVLVVGLGPAGYTLAHHLAQEGFGVACVDGLKLEPLPDELTGHNGDSPEPVDSFAALCTELSERLVMGFGGVSEYGITVRWDKNFLTLLYLTLSRHPHIRMYGGVRFGGTLTLDDAWSLGFDHVAIAAGAGRPTVIDIKNNLARGIRAASDFLMALQLSGAYKKTSLANLEVSLPAIVIGGGLTAIDTATELAAYYLVQIEKERTRHQVLTKELGPDRVRALYDDEEWNILTTHLGHAEELEAERTSAKREGREVRVSKLLDSWGGVSLVYRKSLQDSPAYRLNHEEVQKSLEEGVRYIENLSPTEAELDNYGRVRAMKFSQKDGTVVTLPARTVCVAAGTQPNVTYEREYSGTFEFDDRHQYFRPFAAHRSDTGAIELSPAPRGSGKGFFTSYLKDGHTVSFYGDNHPHYAGSVVRAMASAKDGYPQVKALFGLADDVQAPMERLDALFSRLDDELVARVVNVTRLTDTIVEVVVHAPMAARKFQPGQFYRLQNFEAFAPVLENTSLAMEGLALTGAWTDPDKGLLGTIVLEMGTSSRLCAALVPGEPIILMGPTGTPTEIANGETVLLCGGGLGNAVLFSIARAFKALGSKVIYFAGYKRGEDLFKQSDIEQYTDQIVWTTDAGASITPRRAQDSHFRGNIVQAMVAYGRGDLGAPIAKLSEVRRIIAIGSDRMMNAVREARHGVLAPLLDPRHIAIGSINSPMQCMMKEVCAQCLQKHRDPVTGKETVVFSCMNQDQELDRVDFGHLSSRLRMNSMQEKMSGAWLELLLKRHDKRVIRV